MPVYDEGISWIDECEDRRVALRYQVVESVEKLKDISAVPVNQLID